MEEEEEEEVEEEKKSIRRSFPSNAQIRRQPNDVRPLSFT